MSAVWRQDAGVSDVSQTCGKTYSTVLTKHHPRLNSLPCRRFHWVRRVFDCLKPPYWIEKSGNLGLVKGKGDGGGEREIFSPLPLPRRLLSPNTNPKGFNFSPPLGVKVKDGGHGITTKTNNLLRPHCRSPLKDLIELINQSINYPKTRSFELENILQALCIEEKVTDRKSWSYSSLLAMPVFLIVWLFREKGTLFARRKGRDLIFQKPFRFLQNGIYSQLFYSTRHGNGQEFVNSGPLSLLWK